MNGLTVKYEQQCFSNYLSITYQEPFDFTGRRKKFITMQQLVNVQDIAPSNLFPILIYMTRGKGHQTDFSVDWWYFTNDGACLFHKGHMVRGWEIFEDAKTKTPDTDISHLLEEKELLQQSLEYATALPMQNAHHTFESSSICALIKKIIKQQ